MMLTVPAEIRLTCPQCGISFSLPVRSLSERTELNCPLCRQAFFWFDGLSATLKREVQQEVEETVRNLLQAVDKELAGKQAEMSEDLLRMILQRIVARRA